MNSRFRSASNQQSSIASKAKFSSANGTISCNCIVCGAAFDPFPDRGSLYFDTMLRGICANEDCIADYWSSIGVKSCPPPTVKFRAPSSQYEATPARNTREEVTQRVHDRRNQVATYFHAGLDIGEITGAMNVPRWRVTKDLLALGLEYVDERKAQALALPADIAWRQGAKIVGVPKSTFCAWMREAGRIPPPRKRKSQKGSGLAALAT